MSSYDFTGFFQPVDKAKFSLGGDQGLNIFEAGYPKSQQITCDSTATVDGIEETVPAGSSDLYNNASTDTYTYQTAP